VKLGTSWYGYELVLGTSWLGYELAGYDLVRVRVDWKPLEFSYLYSLTTASASSFQSLASNSDIFDCCCYG